MKGTAKTDLFRKLPSVDELLREQGVAALVARHGSSPVTDATRTVLARLREEIFSGLLDDASLGLALAGVNDAIEKQILEALRPSLRPVINATGVILHTNLGRAPLAESVFEHLSTTAGQFSNLEFDLEKGDRGQRDVHVDRLFRKLVASRAAFDTGSAEQEAQDTVSTIVVNNNAAAVLLALNTLAEGGEVIVSRGELVEIGGSFRIPDVMAKSGATLREVGTTNRTRIGDYERAITERTRLLLRVHRSNFEIKGFTEQASTAELVNLGRQRDVPVVEDLGSGALVDLQNFGINGEPNVLDSLRAGFDVVTYSGDKLLGGPQAGLISGGRDLVTRMRKNSLFRALRVDKLIYAALESTLLAYAKRDYDGIPTLKMMSLTKGEITARAQALVANVHSPKLQLEILDGESVIGGGAAPSSVLPTSLVAISCAGLSADELSVRLRSGSPPIIARVEQERVVLDLRTVFPDQDRVIATAVAGIAT